MLIEVTEGEAVVGRSRWWRELEIECHHMELAAADFVVLCGEGARCSSGEGREAGGSPSQRQRGSLS